MKNIKHVNITDSWNDSMYALEDAGILHMSDLLKPDQLRLTAKHMRSLSYADKFEFINEGSDSDSLPEIITLLMEAVASNMDGNDSENINKIVKKLINHHLDSALKYHEDKIDDKFIEIQDRAHKKPQRAYCMGNTLEGLFSYGGEI